MSRSGPRALHYVLKTGNRFQSWHFFHRILGMEILRHEEFDEGCKATCNGPYEGKWSKTMLGYGNEDENFVIELTYNYGVSTYKRGNDFQSVNISSKGGIMDRVLEGKFQYTQKCPDSFTLISPCGYTFNVDEPKNVNVADRNENENPKVTKVTLACSDLGKTAAYYKDVLKMTEFESGEDYITVGFGKDQTKLEMRQIKEPLRREAAFGRTAFSCPASQLPDIEATVKAADGNILTPLVSLDTPGKATVQVVILGDPDGHEICFVGDEAFRELSQVDPEASEKILDAMAADKSDDWYKKHGKDKEER